MTKTKRGICQSRGLGDIVIALPIAKFYHDKGDEIYWPICDEFMSSFTKTVPWVNWISVPTDQQGAFFLQTPLQKLEEIGVKQEDVLYLYQYLNSVPELTDPELFNILKFDQYKYWVSTVPFKNKWLLGSCITRDVARENKLRKKLKLPARYAVVHLTGSNFRADIDLSWLDPAVKVINIDDHKTDNIWDWLGVLEGAEAFVGVDSVYANIVDSLELNIPELFWIRRSPWDLTPVLGSLWTMVPTTLPIQEPQRVNPAAEAQAKMEAQQRSRNISGVSSHVPFQASGAIPTNFMHAVKQAPSVPSTNINLMSGPTLR